MENVLCNFKKKSTVIILKFQRRWHGEFFRKMQKLRRNQLVELKKLPFIGALMKNIRTNFQVF